MRIRRWPTASACSAAISTARMPELGTSQALRTRPRCLPDRGDAAGWWPTPGPSARRSWSPYNEPLITAEWSMAICKARAAGLMTGFEPNGNGTTRVLDFVRP